jgi:hypothetical protein
MSTFYPMADDVGSCLLNRIMFVRIAFYHAWILFCSIFTVNTVVFYEEIRCSLIVILVLNILNIYLSFKSIQYGIVQVNFL